MRAKRFGPSCAKLNLSNLDIDCDVNVYDIAFKSLFYSSIKKTSYRNNFLDLEKYSLKQSFNFKKRVGESHVLLHNILVELFKGKHKTAF